MGDQFEYEARVERPQEFLHFAVGFMIGLKIVSFLIERRNREEEQFLKFLREYDGKK